VQLSATGHQEVGAAVDDAQADVGFELALEAGADLAAGGKLAFFAGKWAGVGADLDLQGRGLDLHDGKGFGVFAIGDGAADVGGARRR
jgi:hypothetical protein